VQLAGLYPFDPLDAAKVHETFVSIEEATGPLWSVLSIHDAEARKVKTAEIVANVGFVFFVELP
jgi:hypothetical protein